MEEYSTAILFHVHYLFFCNNYKMWQILVLYQIYAFLISQSDCGKISPFGEFLGVLGPTIIEKPNKVDDDVTVVVTAISKNQLKPLAKLVGGRTLAQRLAIDLAYQKKSAKNVTTAIDDLLNTKGSGDTVDLYEGFFLPLPVYLAKCIFFSISQKDHRTYMSIICTSSATKLKAINEAYFQYSGKQLVDDMKHYKGDESRVLMQMLDPKFMRPDSGSDKSKVEEQMKYIPNGGDVKCDNNEDLFKFMTSTSFEQIKLVANTWSSKNEKKLVVDMFRENCKKGLMQEAYKRIVRYSVDPYQYMAEEFYLAKKGGNTLNTNAQKYLLTTRSEVDLKDVMKSYNNYYQSNMVGEIQDNGASDYNDLFLAVLVGNAGV